MRITLTVGVRRSFKTLGVVLEIWRNQLLLLLLKDWSTTRAQYLWVVQFFWGSGHQVKYRWRDKPKDLIEDAKFYQDVAINYQNAYEALLAQQAELQGMFEAQSHLIQETSAAIDAAETEAKTHHQELLQVRWDQQKEMASVVSKMVEQYKVQLTSAQGSLQSRDLEHNLEVQKLQEKIHAREVSLAEHGASSLPSVRVSQQVPSNTALCSEVFNIIPGTVNQHWGVAQYSSQDQAFSFQKQVQFKPGSSPYLGSTTSPDPELWPQSSTPLGSHSQIKPLT